MKIDKSKLDKAIADCGLSERSFYGMFGGRRRVNAWTRKCYPRYMGRVRQVLGVSVESLLVTKADSKSVGQSITVEVKAEPKQAPKPVEQKRKPPSQMNKEQLIVEAHRLQPEIDLPDNATKKELLAIVKSLK
jgi:hypothetical protein